MPVENINWDKHDVVECDDRGRATLGSEYANERVFVHVAPVAECRECGIDLGAGYLCDECDELEIHD
jgi:hypothetical protein